MKIKDYLLFSQLNTDYKCVCDIYGECNVYGIFAFGKVNTSDGIETIEDFTTEAIIFPTFEDVCLNKIPVKTSIGEGRITIKDIRYIYNDITIATNGLLDEALNTNYRIINLQYEKLFEFYMLNNKSVLEGINLSEQEAVKKLKYCITETLRIVFNENSLSIDFIKNLTDTEKLGLSAILEKLENGEGIISIAKICKDRDISRYVLDNLLKKLKDSQMAAVTSWGPRGMQIKITDYRLLNF